VVEETYGAVYWEECLLHHLEVLLEVSLPLYNFLITYFEKPLQRYYFFSIYGNIEEDILQTRLNAENALLTFPFLPPS